jgi:exosome complex component RRP40
MLPMLKEISYSQYVPAPQELVIGVVTQKVGEGYRVDVGSAHPASLDGLAFEGATKRNKPNLKVPSISSAI